MVKLVIRLLLRASQITRCVSGWMPSASLNHWANGRMHRLNEVEVQCAASVSAVPANSHLIDENLRGFILLLSAHFRGFCRDLYTECAQVVASKVRATLRIL